MFPSKSSSLHKLGVYSMKFVFTTHRFGLGFTLNNQNIAKIISFYFIKCDRTKHYRAYFCNEEDISTSADLKIKAISLQNNHFNTYNIYF